MRKDITGIQVDKLGQPVLVVTYPVRSGFGYRLARTKRHQGAL